MAQATAHAASALRIPGLDGVRGIAILLVLVLHCFAFLPNSPLTKALHYVISGMWLGVDLFFVLSGFLITRILIETRGTPNYFRYFYARRVFRILPAYYLVLGFILLVYPQINPVVDLTPETPYLLLQMQNWYFMMSGQVPWPGVSHFWSLAIEEQFYLLWPLVVLHTPARHLARVCLLVFAASALSRAGLIAGGADWRVFYSATFSHLDGLAAGAWVAAVSSASARLTPTQQQWLTRIGGLCLLALIPLILAARGRIDPVLMALCIGVGSVGFAALVYHVQAGQLPTWFARGMSHPVLVWLGRYSYGIYLIHLAVQVEVWVRVQQWSASWLGSTPNLQILLSGCIAVTLTLVSARLMYQWVEAPALRYARRYSAGHAAPDPPQR